MSSDVIPSHQSCTDCKKRKRALAEGKPGYASLCVDCFTERMKAAQVKRQPSRAKVGSGRSEWSAQQDRMLEEAINSGVDLKLDNPDDL